MKLASFTAILALSLSLPALAQQGQQSQQGQQVDQLAFLSGHWVQKKNGEEVQENWLGPRAETMVATNLTSREGKPANFEFLRIARKDGKIIYFASPSGRPATEFPLKELTVNAVVFENPEHAFPRRILYTRVDKDTLVARIEGRIKDQDMQEEWRFTRIP